MFLSCIFGQTGSFLYAGTGPAAMRCTMCSQLSTDAKIPAGTMPPAISMTYVSSIVSLSK